MRNKKKREKLVLSGKGMGIEVGPFPIPKCENDAV